MKAAIRNDNGYTLVEIMVSLLIFSLVLLPLTAVLVAESKFERSRRQKVEAMLVAKNEIEKSKNAPGVLDDAEYTAALGGKQWSVRRTVENREAVTAGGATAMQHALITVRVGRENDTATLALFRVMKETYR